MCAGRPGRRTRAERTYLAFVLALLALPVLFRPAPLPAAVLVEFRLGKLLRKKRAQSFAILENEAIVRVPFQDFRCKLNRLRQGARLRVWKL